MAWLSQNWIWIALAIGAFFFFSRMGMGGCGMGSMRGRGSGNASSTDRESASTAPFDPVSRRAIVGGTAISSVYQGQAYYFESRDNREAFEGDPGKYLSGSSQVGQPIGSPDSTKGNARRRAGCC